jgi:chitinase
MAKVFLRRTVLVAVALLSACTVHNSDVPSLSGPSEGSGPLQVPTQSPTARFSFAPSAPAAFAGVQFDGSLSCPGPADPNGTAVCPNGNTALTSYQWNFGDGSTASGQVAGHVFRGVSTYGVTLTVTNTTGRTHTTAHSVSVGVGLLPTADFTVSPTDPEPHRTVVFDGQTSKPGVGHTIVRYIWGFGDFDQPNPAEGPIVSHQFFLVGTFTVTLTVVDESGQTATTTKSVNVKPRS